MEQCPSANTNKSFWLSLLSLQRQSASTWSDRVLVYPCCTLSRVSNPAVPLPPSLTESPKSDGLRCPIFSPQLDMLSRFGLDNALIWTCLSRISTSDVPCQRKTAFSLRQHRATPLRPCTSYHRRRVKVECETLPAQLLLVEVFFLCVSPLSDLRYTFAFGLTFSPPRWSRVASMLSAEAARDAAL